MTKVYFVRHAQPDHGWKDDRTRPLTAEGEADAKIVLDVLQDKKIDMFFCSPYKRSIDTIFDYHEENGESIRMVQERNIAALTDILAENKDKNIVVGTHGTALSTILNFFNPEFGCKDFLRIIDWMPYVIELDFEGNDLTAMKEHCHIEKEFTGENRADKAV